MGKVVAGAMTPPRVVFVSCPWFATRVNPPPDTNQRHLLSCCVATSRPMRSHISDKSLTCSFADDPAYQGGELEKVRLFDKDERPPRPPGRDKAHPALICGAIAVLAGVCTMVVWWLDANGEEIFSANGRR